MTCYVLGGQKQFIKRGDEFAREMEKRGGAIQPEHVAAGTNSASFRVYGHAHRAPFGAESFKRVAEDICAKSGVELLYHAIVVYFGAS